MRRNSLVSKGTGHTLSDRDKISD